MSDFVENITGDDVEDGPAQEEPPPELPGPSSLTRVSSGQWPKQVRRRDGKASEVF